MTAKRLSDRAAARLTGDLISASAGDEVQDLVEPFSRPADLAPLSAVLQAARGRFDKAVEADAWLAPRVHAALRLTRREAADEGLWHHLGLVDFPAYVDWRWRTAEPDLSARNRYLGSVTNHAVGRLWWGGEFLRNGGDYADVVIGFGLQDIPNTWFRLDLFHNRVAAMASVRTLSVLNDGGFATGDQANELATALRTTLTTISVEALAPEPDSDVSAVTAWIGETPDVEELLADGLPQGPQDPPVDLQAVAAMTEFIEKLVKDQKIEGLDRVTRRGSPMDKP